jgi:Rod binding domain-containing protein
MTEIGSYNAAASSLLPAALPPRVAAAAGESQLSTSLAPRIFSLRDQGNSTDELRKQFTQFVGETFYGQMIKAMRSTVGKPAYFHGGRGEEVFQGQLDQKFSEYMTAASAEKFAEPMFEQQFPNLVQKSPAVDMDQLTQLRAR